MYLDQDDICQRASSKGKQKWKPCLSYVASLWKENKVGSGGFLNQQIIRLKEDFFFFIIKGN